MSRPCRDCGEPIGWGKTEDGRPMPIDADGKDHRDTCEMRRGQVANRLKRPSRHHTSASKIKRFEECQLAFFYEYVAEKPPAPSTEEMDLGKLVHAAIEFVIVERAKAKNLAAPVVADELLAALELVAGRESWNTSSLGAARALATSAASRIDLSFAAVDELGPFVERGFELPVGAGVMVGGVLDLVEHVGDAVIVTDFKTGGFRDPDPKHLPAVGLYAAFAHALWPEKETRVVLRYLALEIDDEIPWSQELEDDAKAMARALVLKTRTRAKDESAWPATFGAHCARCPFKAECPAYKREIALDPRTLPSVEALPALVPALHEASVMEKLWAARKDALKSLATPLVVEQLGATRRGTFGGVSVLVKSRAPYLREAQPAKLVEGATWIETRPARADDGGAPPKAIETTAPDEREAKARALVEAPLELPGLLCTHEKTFATTVGGAQKRECSMCGAVLATEARQEPARGQGAGAAVNQAAEPASAAAPASGLVDLVRIGEPGSDSCCLCNCDLRSQRLPTGGERVTVRGALDDGRQACLPCWSQLPETKDGNGRRKAPPAAPVDAPLIFAPPACRACGKPAGEDPLGLCFACSQLSLPCEKPAARAPGYADVPGTVSGTYQTCYSCGEILKTGEDKGLCGRCLKRPCAYCGKATARLTICDDHQGRPCCDSCVTAGAYKRAPDPLRPLGVERVPGTKANRGCLRVDLGKAGVAIVCTRGKRCKHSKLDAVGLCTSCGKKPRPRKLAKCERCGIVEGDQGAHVFRNGTKADGSPAPLLCGVCVTKPASAPAGATQ